MRKWNTYQREVRTRKAQLCCSCLTMRDSGAQNRSRTECFCWDKCLILLLWGPGRYHNFKVVPNYGQVREVCFLFLLPVQLRGGCGTWKKMNVISQRAQLVFRSCSQLYPSSSVQQLTQHQLRRQKMWEWPWLTNDCLIMWPKTLANCPI